MGKRLGVKQKDQAMAHSVGEMATADEHAGAGHSAELAVDRISGNARNPRFRAVTPEQVAELRNKAQAQLSERGGSAAARDDAFFDTVTDLVDAMELEGSDELPAEERRSRLHSIIGLARSINRVNLIQPITVYPHETGYEVLAGQRRYLAHLLLGRREIRSIIRQPSGDQLSDSLAAVVENLAREELSLRERVEAIQEIVDLHETSFGTMNAAALQQYLGESRRTCQRYLRILREPAVRDGIRGGDVTSLRQAAQLVDSNQSGSEEGDGTGQKGPGRRTRSAPAGQGSPEGEGAAGSTQASPKRATRPKTRVSLGAVYNCDEVYRLMTGFLGSETFHVEYGSVDWDDYRAVEDAWRSFWTRYIANGGDS